MKTYSGVWPTMITIFDENGSLDLEGNRKLTEYLIKRGSSGLFAVCQSSEMFFLTTDEKALLAKTVVETARGRVPVIASGHTADSIEKQIEELCAVSAGGVDALVLVSNRLAKKEEDSGVLLKNLKTILDAFPGEQIGIYECPYPYLRLLTDEELKWCADSGRIVFIKDVSCNAETQKRRAKLVQGSSLKLFNANSETLLSSLQAGYAGFNGVMGNFHIDLYRWLYENFLTKPAECAALQALLTEKSRIETQGYPINAKYHATLEGLPVDIFSRRMPKSDFTPQQKQVVHDLFVWEAEIRKKLGFSGAGVLE